MHGLTLDCFGVGDGAACGDRNHSASLYQFPETCFLIDCGEPVSRSYKASGYSYDAIDRIVISHLHFDHIGGLFMLLQGFWLEKRQKLLPIHMPREGIAAVQSMLQAGYLFDELLPFELNFEPLQAGQVLAAKGVKVTPYPTTHLNAFRRRFGVANGPAFEAFSFLIETEGLRIVHSADLGSPRDLDPLLASRVDLLICELAHFAPEDLFRYLEGREIDRIAFTHLGRPFWEKLAEIQELAAQLLPNHNYTFLKDHARLTL